MKSKQNLSQSTDIKDTLIWLHEDALRVSHQVFKEAPANCEAVFIWDDDYLQKANYSLKRLVFLYETLCELPVIILYGKTLEILKSHKATQIYTPSSPNPWIKLVCEQLRANKNVIEVVGDSFVDLKDDEDFIRFFKYWKKIEKSAFTVNGSL